jgi:serum/glucocorticoid-regulated kinase 2
VYLVKRKPVAGRKSGEVRQRFYAMKVMRKAHIQKRNTFQNAMNERDILGASHCPFIVRLKYAFQSQDKLYLVLEFTNGGELFYHLNKKERFDSDMVRFYAAELILALDYLHK